MAGNVSFKKMGAEAILYLENGCLVKERVCKRYRLREIDEKIRRLRTSLEASLIAEARRHRVSAPAIFEVDKKGFKIKMEFIDGVRVKEHFYSCSERDVKKISFKIGESVGRLHSAGIVHGDLTTSNMILRNGEVFFIDFGLGFFSKRIEDYGTDLKLLKEAIQSTHFKILKICWDNILKGYKKEYKDAERVIEKVKEIETRARYAQKQEQI
jgi:Kae1-associated kinase Bud32